MTGSSCWICGQPSDTAEHRIKKSDVTSRFGKGPYRGDDALVHVKQEQVRDLQGPKSKLIKYEKNLCAQCNNVVSQPFDDAYKQFVEWTMANENDVVKRRVVDFQDVYGASWASKQRDLFKYFAKCFGCRVNEADRNVPSDVVDLIQKESFETSLYVTMQVNEDQLLLAAEDQAIGTQDLIAHLNKETSEVVGYQCGSHYRWLTVMFWYNHFPLRPVGANWVANSKFLYLGWYQPLSNEARGELVAKLAELRKQETAETRAAVLARAYEIWKNEHHPQGCDWDHWFRAKHELGIPEEVVV